MDVGYTLTVLQLPVCGAVSKCDRVYVCGGMNKERIGTVNCDSRLASCMLNSLCTQMATLYVRVTWRKLMSIKCECNEQPGDV